MGQDCQDLAWLMGAVWTFAETAREFGEILGCSSKITCFANLKGFEAQAHMSEPTPPQELTSNVKIPQQSQNPNFCGRTLYAGEVWLFNFFAIIEVFGI